jgi:hypothetical protein
MIFLDECLLEYILKDLQIAMVTLSVLQRSLCPQGGAIRGVVGFLEVGPNGRSQCRGWGGPLVGIMGSWSLSVCSLACDIKIYSVLYSYHEVPPLLEAQSCGAT